MRLRISLGVTCMLLLVLGCTSRSDGEELGAEFPSAISHREEPINSEPTDASEQRPGMEAEGEGIRVLGPLPHRMAELPSCTDERYTVSPVEVAEIASITALGNLNPPEHTIPTQHMYLHVPNEGVALHAPGDITITSISSSSYQLEGVVDYSLEFALCKQIRGYFLHIKRLAPEIEEAMEADQCRVYGENDKYKHCYGRTNIPVVAGAVIGYVSDNRQHNFDFGTYDTRVEHAYANPDRYADKSKQIICPLSLYDGSLRKSLFAKIEQPGEPNCGVVAQDVEDTLQGNWFFGETHTTDPAGWSEQLAFVISNKNPAEAVISIGGVIGDAGVIRFTPRDEGTRNRKFSDVVQDDMIYCYRGIGVEGQLLVQLKDEFLLVELQRGTCSGNYIFENQYTYVR